MDATCGGRGGGSWSLPPYTKLDLEIQQRFLKDVDRIATSEAVHAEFPLTGAQEAVARAFEGARRRHAAPTGAPRGATGWRA